MDGLTRVACYFPSQSLTSFWIVSNLILNNSTQCEGQTRSLLIAVIVIFCIFVLICSFTDTYTASNNQKYIVVLMPLYGPACLSLPSDYDKDRVYDHYYLKIRDYIRACTTMIAFLFIVLFINPIAPCLYPNYSIPGASRLDPTILRTVPIVVAITSALFMMCLGTPRQSLGFQNVDETCKALGGTKGEMSFVEDNPMYEQNDQGYPLAPSIPEGDEIDYDQEPVRHQQGVPYNKHAGKEMYGRP